MPFLFAPPPQAVLPVVGEKNLWFPLHRAYFVGLNYAEHNKELGNWGEPMVFLKPVDAVVPVPEGSVAEIPYPTETEDFEHEVELVVALKAGGKNLSIEEAEKAVYGFAVGCDFTRRDLHRELRERRDAWEKAKTVDQALPVTAIRKIEQTPEIENLAIWLYVGSEKRQDGTTDDMILTVPEIIASISKYWELKAGDIIFTGTPKGVGPVKKGDVLKAGVAGVGTLDMRIV